MIAAVAETSLFSGTVRGGNRDVRQKFIFETQKIHILNCRAPVCQGYQRKLGAVNATAAPQADQAVRTDLAAVIKGCLSTFVRGVPAPS